MEVEAVLLTTRQAAEATGIPARTLGYWLRTGRVAAIKPMPEADSIGYRVPVGALRGYLRKVMHEGGKTERRLDEWLAGDGRHIVEFQQGLGVNSTQVLEHVVE